MIKGLFLDDERYPEDVTWVEYPNNVEWVIARTHYDFMDELKNSSFDIISFDHDIQCFDITGGEITGYMCLQWYIHSIMNGELAILPDCVFHTKNPIGECNMVSYYNNFKKYQQGGVRA